LRDAPRGGAFAAFTTVVGTMVAYFAAVILNFGDFSRYVRSTADMRLGRKIACYARSLHRAI